jgi:hypothetical protein
MAANRSLIQVSATPACSMGSSRNPALDTALVEQLAVGHLIRSTILKKLDLLRPSQTGQRARDQDWLAGVTERPHSCATSAKNARYAGSSSALMKVISDWPRKAVFFFIS